MGTALTWQWGAQKCKAAVVGVRENIRSSKSAILLQRGPVDPKFQVEGIAPQNHSSSQKTRLNVLSYGI